MDNDLNNKILFGIEKISQIKKILYIFLYKKIKLSPIQIQIVEFIYNNKNSTVTILTKEFSLKKSTISDSVKVLIKKDIVKKIKNQKDSRIFYLELTDKGIMLLKEKKNIDSHLKEILNLFSDEEKEIVHKFFVILIKSFYQKGIIERLKICFNCTNFSEKENIYFCNFLQQQLYFKDIVYNCNFFNNKK